MLHFKRELDNQSDANAVAILKKYCMSKEELRLQVKNRSRSCTYIMALRCHVFVSCTYVPKPYVDKLTELIEPLKQNILL